MCFLSLTASNIEWGGFSTSVEMTVRQEGAWQLDMRFLPPAASGAEWEDISIWLPALEMIECGAPLLSSDV